MDEIRRGVRQGLLFVSADNKHIGRISRCGAEHFEVEHGFFFPRESLVSYSEIAEVRGNTAISKLTKAQLEELWHRLDSWGPGTFPPQQA